MKRFIVIILVSSFLLCSISTAMDLQNTAGAGRLSSIGAICGQHSRLSFDTSVVPASNNEKNLFDMEIYTRNQLSISRVIPDPWFLSYRWGTSEWYPDTVSDLLT
jgi:hypothetical protein